MDVDKNELRRQFAKDWETHYKLRSLMERGFARRKCKACGRMFWSLEERERCGDSSCIGYQFIGSTPVKKKLGLFIIAQFPIVEGQVAQASSYFLMVWSQ